LKDHDDEIEPEDEEPAETSAQAGSREFRAWMCVDGCVSPCVCVWALSNLSLNLVPHHRLELGKPNRALDAWAEEVKAVITAVGEPSPPRASLQAEVPYDMTTTSGVHNRKRAADVATFEEPEVGTTPPRQAKRRWTAPVRGVGCAVRTAHEDVIDLTQD
jgi:hypothetical protein